MITYLYGILCILGFIGYIVGFNWACWRLCGEKMWDGGNYDPFGGLIIPLAVPFIIIVIIYLPYLIGTELKFW